MKSPGMNPRSASSGRRDEIRDNCDVDAHAAIELVV